MIGHDINKPRKQQLSEDRHLEINLKFLKVYCLNFSHESFHAWISVLETNAKPHLNIVLLLYATCNCYKNLFYYKFQYNYMSLRIIVPFVCIYIYSYTRFPKYMYIYGYYLCCTYVTTSIVAICLNFRTIQNEL